MKYENVLCGKVKEIKNFIETGYEEEGTPNDVTPNDNTPKTTFYMKNPLALDQS